MQDLSETIDENAEIIGKKIDLIKGYLRKYDDNGNDTDNDNFNDNDNDSDKLVTCLKDFELFYKLNALLNRIFTKFLLIQDMFRDDPSFNDRNKYLRAKLRHFYESVKIDMTYFRESILLNLNYAKSLILQLPKSSENIEYLNLFDNTPESCLMCHNKKNEELVCGFDKCHHKICKNCEEMFYLQNIICPIENQIKGSRFISNPLDVEKILINACQNMKMNYLKSNFKMIEFTKENYFKMLTGDRSKLCQLNVTTFISILSNEFLKWERVSEIKKIYSSYYSSNADNFP